MKKILIIILLLTGAGSSSAETVKLKPAIAKKPVPKAASVNLETAYKREFAFLAAQKRELKKRLSNYKVKAGRDERKLEQKISRLEQTSVDNSALIDNLDSELADAERTETSMDERSEVLDMTFNQAETTLEAYKIDAKQSGQFQQGNEQKIHWIFTQALELLDKLGQQRSEKGKFYLRDGKEAQGHIIRLGNIASFGISKQGNGALAPAGGESFKLWKESTDDVAIKLASNNQPDTLKLFLYESQSKVINEKPEKTWLDVIESGGIIGWIIVVLGTLGALLILLRCYLLFINSRATLEKTKQVMQLIGKGGLEEARQVCAKESCAITRVMSATLRHLKDDRDHMEDIIVEAILNESAPINRYGPAILVIASVAPLLGLLGTVTGMISTFDIITEFGTGDPKLLSSGISVALVTTKLGLIVAIPTLMFGSLLSAWATNIKRDMEKSALMITNAVLGGGNAEIARVINEQKQTGTFKANTNFQPA